MFSVLDWTMGSITYLHDDAASHTYATKLKSAEFELILTSRLGIDLWQDLVDDPVFRPRAAPMRMSFRFMLTARRRSKPYDGFRNGLVNKELM
jgi:hypothetical protein